MINQLKHGCAFERKGLSFHLSQEEERTEVLLQRQDDVELWEEAQDLPPRQGIPSLLAAHVSPSSIGVEEEEALWNESVRQEFSPPLGIQAERIEVHQASLGSTHVQVRKKER